jgi:hypothetical protein
MVAVADEEMSVGELAADIVELTRVHQMVDVLVARKTKSLSDRGGHDQLGYPSPTAFLADQGRMSAGEARRVVSRSQTVEKAPLTYRAWADGRLSTGQAAHLFRAAEAVPDSYPDAEERLLDIVEGLSVTDTGRTIEYWRQSVDGPGDIETETQLVRRGLSVSKTTGGMRRVDGWLTSLAGQALETALDALMTPPGPDDTRTPRQRRHDALEDLTRDWLDHADTPRTGGEKPNIILLTDLPALQSVAGGTHETLDGQIISIDALRQTACGASITRIIFGADSEILDIGRKTRVWTTTQRRAITTRDRHCQAPGCERPPQWCDIHHLQHWADGGATTVDNATKSQSIHIPSHLISPP